MSGARPAEVAAADDDIRLDRWFKRHFPDLTHGRLEKLLRTGQVRVDGGRAKAGQRLRAGQRVRTPPTLSASPPAPPAAVDPRDAADIQAAVIHMDDRVIALNKPAGLAVQGGSKTIRHLDALLDALRFGAKERPRLVHRLDKDTSGVLVVARDAAAATKLAASFRGRDATKLYWALVAGAPALDAGTIDLPLAKRGGRGAERAAPDEAAGKAARTDFLVIDHAGKRIAWLALWPRTGRTHQLRVHCAAIGCPILGDAKYGGDAAAAPGFGLPGGMFLHARALDIAHPDGDRVHLQAPPPAPMLKALRMFGFSVGDGDPAPPPAWAGREA